MPGPARASLRIPWTRRNGSASLVFSIHSVLHCEGVSAQQYICHHVHAWHVARIPAEYVHHNISHFLQLSAYVESTTCVFVYHCHGMHHNLFSWDIIAPVHCLYIHAGVHPYVGMSHMTMSHMHVYQLQDLEGQLACSSGPCIRDPDALQAAEVGGSRKGKWVISELTSGANSAKTRASWLPGC